MEKYQNPLTKSCITRTETAIKTFFHLENVLQECEYLSPPDVTNRYRKAVCLYIIDFCIQGE